MDIILKLYLLFVIILSADGTRRNYKKKMRRIESTMSELILQVTNTPYVLGESPHWDDKQQALYFVSIHEQTIHKYMPATGIVTKAKMHGRVGFIIPVEGNNEWFVVGVERSFLVVQWNGLDSSSVEVIKDLGHVDLDEPKNRINAGRADPRGRLFAGTVSHSDAPGKFHKEKGALYRVEGTNITKVDSNISVSNGMAWDLDAKAMYYIDSIERKIRRYDYDIETGDIRNMRYIFDLNKQHIYGYPEGLTIDRKGNLWVAVFEFGNVIRINPRNGMVLKYVPVPVKQVTAVTFGGKNLDQLYVTTASMTINGVEQPPPSGNVFRISGLGAFGWPDLKVRVSDLEPLIYKPHPEIEDKKSLF